MEKYWEIKEEKLSSKQVYEKKRNCWLHEDNISSFQLLSTSLK